MRVIDNRYHVLFLSRSEPLYDKYIVKDIETSKELSLYVFKIKVFNRDFGDFIKTNCYRLTQLDDFALEKSNQFKRIRSIDDELADGIQFYTCQLTKPETDFFNYVHTCSFEQKIDLFVAICKAVFFLHINRLCYHGIPISSIIIFNRNGKINVKLKNIVMRHFDVYYRSSGNYKDADTGEPILFESGREKDLYSLGLILLSILQGSPITSFSEHSLKMFSPKDFATLHEKQVIKIKALIEKLLSRKFDAEYGANTIISELSAILRKKYSSILSSSLENRTLVPDFVSNNFEMQLIISSAFKKEQFIKSENIFLISAAKGMGKTRFLHEIETRLQFIKVLTFSYFDIGAKKLAITCKDFLEKTNLFTQNLKQDSRQIDVSHLDNIDNKNWAKEYFNFFEQARKNIQNLTRSTCVAVLIDDADTITDPEFLNGLLLLAYELKNLNFLLVCTYNSSSKNFEKNIIHRLAELGAHDYYKVFRMTNMNPMLTKKLIMDATYFKDLPIKFAEHFFLKSNGNPAKIISLLNNLFITKKLFINEKTGCCELTPEFEVALKNKQIDSQIIIQNLDNLISSFSEYDISIIKFISVFSGMVDEQWLLNNYQPVEKQYRKNILKQLTRAHVISVRTINGSTKYFISDYVLKDLISSNLSDDEVISLSKLAVEQIESHYTFTDMKELALHLKKSCQNARARRCYLKLAIYYKKKKNLLEIIEQLKYAIECTKRSEHRLLATLYLDTATFLFENANLNDAKKFLKKAATQCRHCKCADLTIEIAVQFMFLYDMLYEHDNFEKYHAETKKLLATTPKRYLKSYSGLIRAEALMDYDANRFDAAVAKCEKILMLSENKPALLKEKSNALRIMADIACRHEDFAKAQTMLEESIRIAEKIRHVRGILYNYINFAYLYGVQKNKAKAMEYYRKTKASSIRYKIVGSELLANDCIANEYLNEKQYQLALQYADYALNMALKVKINTSIMRLSFLLVHIALGKNDPKLATKYFDIAKKTVKKDSMDMYIYDFDVAAVRYYAYFHEHEKVSECLKRLIPYDVLKCGIIIDDAEFFLQLLSLEYKDKSATSDQVFKIINADETSRVLVDHCYHAFFTFLKLGNMKSVRKLLDMFLNIQETELATEDICKIYFIRSFVEKKLAFSQLNEVIKISFSFNLGEIKIYALLLLAQYYYEDNKRDTCLALLIEAALAIKVLLTKIPQEKRFGYFCGQMFFICQKNIDAVLHNREAYYTLGRPNKKIAIAEYRSFIHKDYTRLLLLRHNFYSIISKDLLGLNLPACSNLSVLLNLNTEVKNDLHTLLLKIAAELLATEAFIVNITNKNDVDIIAHFSYLKTLPKLNLFYKITSSTEPVVLTRDQLTVMHTTTDLQSCMTFPIHKRNFDGSIADEILGYVYLDSNYAINLIGKKGLEVLKKYENILGILIQSYNYYQIATIDKLTKALSRDALHAKLKEYSVKYPTFSLLYYDLDSFKQINDTYGHDVGDTVLVTISNVVSSKLADPEILGRQGGEEFIVCLPNTDSKQAFEKAEVIRKAVEATPFLGYNFKITISLGIATYGEHSRIIVDLIQKADHAMYHSKQAGKNQTSIWNDNLKGSSVSIDNVSQIIEMTNFGTVKATNFILDLLKLQNSKHSAKTILELYSEQARAFLAAENNLIIFSRNGKLLDEKKLYQVFGETKPFWFNNVLEFIADESKALKILSDFPSNESNAIFRNGVSILLVPIIFKEKFLGVNCFTTQRYVKEFSFADASIQAFATNMLAHVCYECWQESVPEIRRANT